MIVQLNALGGAPSLMLHGEHSRIDFKLLYTNYILAPFYMLLYALLAIIHINIILICKCLSMKLQPCIYTDVEFLNLLYTGRLFHSYILDESICHFRVPGLFCHFYSILDGKSC